MKFQSIKDRPLYAIAIKRIAAEPVAITVRLSTPLSVL
jgi:hypothetical protein